MFFKNKFENDNFEDIERYEEYQRRKSEAVVKGVGSFIYRLYMYVSIFLATYFVLTLFLIYVFGLDDGFAYFISFISSFIIFKVPYIKEKPFKSLIILGFIFALEFVAFGDIQI